MKKYYYIDIWDDFSIIDNHHQKIDNLAFIYQYYPELTELFWKQYTILLNKPTLTEKTNKIIFQYCKQQGIPFNFVAYQDETCEYNEVIEEQTSIKMIINNEKILLDNEISLGGFYYFLRNISNTQKEHTRKYFLMIYHNQQKSLLKEKK